MRLIDADALEKEMCSGCEYYKNKYANCDDCAIANAPTVDAVPVVRCKDYSYLDEDEFENGDVVLFCNFMRAELNDMEMDNESYCSNGERREP